MVSTFRPVSGALAFALIALGCKTSAGVSFPPPVASTASSCKPLASLTVVADLGSLYPGGGDSSASMAIDENYIYMTLAPSGSPDLYLIPKSGGPPQLLDQGAVAPVFFDGESLVYTRQTTHPSGGGIAMDYPSVIRLSPDGSQVALPNIDGANSVWSGPMVDATGAIDWVAGAPEGYPNLYRWSPITNVTTAITTGEPPLGNFAANSTDLFGGAYSSSSTSGAQSMGSLTIEAIPLAGGSWRSLATLPGGQTLADADEDGVYLLNETTGNENPVVISRVGVTDGAVSTITTVAAGKYALPPSSFLLLSEHDTNVYFPILGDDGELQIARAPKSGGAQEVVLDTSGPSFTVLGLGFDACNVYVAVTAGLPSSHYEILGQGLATAPANAADAGAPAAVDASADASTCAAILGGTAQVTCP